MCATLTAGVSADAFVRSDEQSMVRMPKVRADQGRAPVLFLEVVPFPAGAIAPSSGANSPKNLLCLGLIFKNWRGLEKNFLQAGQE